MPETSATTDGKPDATDDQRKKYEVLLPLYVQHLKELEARCLREGRALLPHEVGWAQECKIQVPDRVRILSLPAIPAPVNDKVRQAEIEFERLTGRPCGAEVAALCVGYGILIRYEYALHKLTLVHELTHVAQNERFGSIEDKVQASFDALLRFGYELSPIETEADKVAEQICRAAQKRGDDIYCGIPWLKGGRDFEGIDCIGLVWLFLRQEMNGGPDCPASPAGQTEMEGIDAALKPFLPFLREVRQRGDVLFFRHQASGLVTHLAVSLDGVKFLSTVRGCVSRIENGTVLMKRVGYDLLGAADPQHWPSIGCPATP